MAFKPATIAEENYVLNIARVGRLRQLLENLKIEY